MNEYYIDTKTNYPHASPSGVSDGHNIPHCDACSERGPETLRVFSNLNKN
jgi:hypothetical protein